MNLFLDTTTNVFTRAVGFASLVTRAEFKARDTVPLDVQFHNGLGPASVWEWEGIYDAWRAEHAAWVTAHAVWVVNHAAWVVNRAAWVVLHDAYVAAHAAWVADPSAPLTSEPVDTSGPAPVEPVEPIEPVEPVDQTEISQLVFVLKEGFDELSDVYGIATEWTRRGVGLYRGVLRLDTAALVSAIGGLPSLKAVGEFTWTEDGTSWESSNTLDVTIYNDVYKGTEVPPTAFVDATGEAFTAYTP